ncbi:hypothetical protein EDD29_6367 [Actinocorallia herbida]|uniref:DUF2071 domain-containing protein n=1 Tax=Actinocorallia herbida TaxID=58109 RepID=A0A3N1D572_9ACTN|nr:DUF2071 domain-containing protein [Actinocorallia herbida]ROO88693.1 hypothetical protein EDD29_6367 [Actinocorallia herbida]
MARGGFGGQTWRDVVFLHWRVAPAEVAPHLPDGVVPDLVDGAAWIGVIGLRMTALTLGGVPYPSFLELNVRLYGRDSEGRPGVVFRAMEASDPVFAAASRASLRLPYTWASMRFAHTRGRVSYATRRLLPDAGRAGVRLRVSVGSPLADPSPAELSLTDRLFLYQRWYGPALRLPVDHDPWPLYSASLLQWHDDGLLSASGLPALPGPPDSVLYSPGVPTRLRAPVVLRG